MDDKRIPMCKKCFTNSVKWADAGIFKSIPYLYCTQCKIEVDSWGQEVKKTISKSDFAELDMFFAEQIAKMDEESALDSELLDFEEDEDNVSQHILYPYKLTP